MLRRKPREQDSTEFLARKRQVILHAARTLATTRHSTDVTFDEIAREADLPSSAVAVFFRSTTEILVESALALARAEVLGDYLGENPPSSGPSTSAFAQHFSRHREFYIVLQSSTMEAALNSALDDLFGYFNGLNARAVLGPEASDARVNAVALAITAAARETVRGWLLDPTAEATAEALYLLLVQLMVDRFPTSVGE